jgi:hypothetical protein
MHAAGQRAQSTMKWHDLLPMPLLSRCFNFSYPGTMCRYPLRAPPPRLRDCSIASTLPVSRSCGLGAPSQDSTGLCYLELAPAT